MSEIFDALQKAQRRSGQQAARLPARGPSRPRPSDRRSLLGDTGDADRSRPETDARPARRWWLPWRKRHDQTPITERDGLLVGADDQNMAGEQFRVLRMYVEFAGPGAVMVTSALASEGKTLCATNLALTLSRSVEADVILVDADLRNPSVGSYFNNANGPGLIDHLTRDVALRDCIVPTPYKSLQILPAGGRSSVAPELLGSKRMEAALEDLKKQFPDHYVIVDAPPILLTADPLVLARHMDRILLVVRAGATPRAAMDKAVERLGRERIFGIVFNGATQNLSDYYHYKGRYPYSYYQGGA